MSAPTNLELLKLATELAYADYNNRRANIHNQWLADNDRMQKLYKASVPYPTIPPYPTEDDIVEKAKKLVEFLSIARPDLETQQDKASAVEQPTESTVDDQQEIVSTVTQPNEQTLSDISALDIEINVVPAQILNTPALEEKPSVFKKIKSALR